MAMVDRYKKSGGFIQLLQVIETCGPKKKEQFMKIISEETPKWADAINLKMLTYDRIINWSSETLMEITAQSSSMAFSISLKSLPEDRFQSFLSKLGQNEKRKFEQVYKEGPSEPNEISACIAKVITETRALFISGVLKYEKVDPELAIPDEFETKLEKMNSSAGSVSENIISLENNANGSLSSANNPSSKVGIQLGNPSDIDALRRKVVELNQVINSLKKDNTLMKDKLDKIKKIA